MGKSLLSISLNRFHWLKIGLFQLFFLISSVYSFGLTSGQVSVTRVSAPYFILDSNSPCVQGPSCGHIAIQVKNTSTTTSLTGIQVNLSSISNAQFALAGNQAQIVKLYTIKPNDSATAYFYIKTSCTANDSANFTFTISDNQAGTVASVFRFYARSSISANAGGQVQSITTSIARNNGTLLIDTVAYTFGNIKIGDEVSFAPTGNTAFKADKLILVNMRVISSSLTGVVVGTTDKLYFVATGNNNGSNIPVSVVYYFINKLGADSTTLLPYAGTTSGNTNYKYTGNYNATGSTVSFVSNPITGLTTTKTVTPSRVAPGDTVTYTVKVTNTNSARTTFDYFEDVLPTNSTYVGLDASSQVTSTNSGSLPTAGATGTIQFIGGNESTVFPYLTYDIAAGDSLKLIYKVKIGTANQSRLDSNSVRLYIGTSASTAVKAGVTVCATLNGTNTTSTSICSGNTLNLTSTAPTNGVAPYSYLWSGPSSFTASTQNATRTNIQTSHSGSYSVRFTDALSCSTSVAATVTVTQTVTPTISVTPSATTICSGTSVNFTTSITNGGTTPTYQWFKNGSSISGANSSTYTASGIANNDSFSVTVTSNAACASPTTASAGVKITVNSAATPTVSLSPSSSTICSGTTINFTTSNTNGGTTPTYQWFKNGSVISGANSSTYSAIGIANNDTFTVVMTSNATCITTSTASSGARITVNPLVTPSITLTPSATTICSGTAVNFTTSNSNGGSTPTYQWFKNGSVISGANSSTYSASGIANNDTFTVVMTSNATCPSPTTASAGARITVNPLVTPTVAVSPSSSSICSGGTLNLSTSISNGGNSPTYQWFKNGSSISGANSSTYTTTSYANNDSFSVTLTSNASCLTTSTASAGSKFSVITTVTPSVTATTDGTKLCTGYTVTFNATPTNGGNSPTYQWLKNGVEIPSATSSSYVYTNYNQNDTISVRMVSNETCVSMVSTTSNQIISNCPLPIKLISFEVTAQNGLGCYKWSSVGEEAGAYYELQYSSNGIDWATAKVVQAKSSNQVENYSVCTAVYGNYLRLRMIEPNGEVGYSPVKSISLEKMGVVFYPNPANTEINLVNLPTKGKVNYTITDIHGRAVQKGQLNGTVLHVESLPVGIYNLLIYDQAILLSKKLVIER